jgi:hypothetical protein
MRSDSLFEHTGGRQGTKTMVLSGTCSLCTHRGQFVQYVARQLLDAIWVCCSTSTKGTCKPHARGGVYEGCMQNLMRRGSRGAYNAHLFLVHRLRRQLLTTTLYMMSHDVVGVVAEYATDARFLFHFKSRPHKSNRTKVFPIVTKPGSGQSDEFQVFRHSHLQVFRSADGKFVRNNPNNSQWTARSPAGLALDEHRNFLVCEYNDLVMSKIDQDGKWLDSKQLATGRLRHEGYFCHIMCCDRGEIFVVFKRGASVYNADTLDLLRTFVLDLVEPMDCVADASQLYVSDGTTRLVHVFDRSEGKLLRQIGKGLNSHDYTSLWSSSPNGQRWICKDGCFLRPSGLVLNEVGNLFVVDCLVGNIQIFSPTGLFLWSFNVVRGNQDISTGCGLALDQSKRLIVCSKRGVYGFALE